MLSCHLLFFLLVTENYRAVRTGRLVVFGDDASVLVCFLRRVVICVD